MDVTHILDGLNERQRQAVTAPRGNLLVVAGAGSGKTRVLVHRIAWLVEVEHAPPSSVLAVTFTNKAAGEMRARAKVLLGGSAPGMWVGTFHGIAHRLLRMHWDEADLPRNFQILDADDQLRRVKRVLRERQLDERKWPPRQAVWQINQWKEKGQRARDVKPRADDFLLVTHAAVYAHYEAACRREGLVDFAELLLRSHELWQEQPDLLAHYQRRFRNLLVDEFQDTNRVQYQWLRALAGNAGADAAAVWAVGDDDQAIYGWRGATVANIRRFQEDFQDVGVVRLERNYRSTGMILRAANALITRNTERLGKNLWTTAGDGSPIRLYAGCNEGEEARFIAARVFAWIVTGDARTDMAEFYRVNAHSRKFTKEQLRRASQVAVFYRVNAQSRAIEQAFLSNKIPNTKTPMPIPYRIYGGLRFYDRAEVKNALAYMRLVATRHADIAFERVVNTPPRGIGAKTVEVIRATARERGVSMWQACKENLAEGVFKGGAVKTVGAFLRLVDDIAAATVDLGLDELAAHCVDASGLRALHASEGGERGLDKEANLDELINSCAEFGRQIVVAENTGEDAGPATELEEFLGHAALEGGEHQSAGPAVQMMTLHSAKGLEFPLVFIAGMEDGLFPGRHADDPGKLEEERRLAYVGLTRAMRELYLTYAEARRLYGYGDSTGTWPSRFLNELPVECMEEVRLGGSLTRPMAARRANGDRAAAGNEGSGLRVGQRVAHPYFGEGVILQADGAGERTRVNVRFERAGSKWLMLTLANLMPLD